MSDELRVVVDEGGIAEHVIGVDVCVDHVTHRQRRDTANRISQCATHRVGSSRVDDRHAPVSDDESEVRDVAGILAGHRLLTAVVDVDPGSGIVERKRRQARGNRRAGEKGDQRNPGDPRKPADQRGPFR